MSVRKAAAAFAVICTALVLAPVTAGAQTQTPTSGQTVTQPPTTTSLKRIPITGVASNGRRVKGGRFTVERFVARNGRPYALGTFTGTIGRRHFSRSNVAIPVLVGSNGNVRAAATCQVLHLELGPLDLNLLGLRVHLDRVVLDITAQSGPGNLLGNLLCSVANLLNQQPALPVGQVAALLNILLQLLNNPPLLTL
jgi:hypothetical protein